MQRHVHDMPIEMDSDPEFTPSSHNSHNSSNNFASKRRVTRKQAENTTDQHGTNEPRNARVLDLARSMWPANDPVTPAISERKIRELELGNGEQKLMAAFARHVINPGRNRRTGSKWVARRSLRKAFPEHFGHVGFFGHSSWKDKQAADFGLPDLFLRSVDLNRACLTAQESVDDLFEDLGQAPALKALTAEEYQQLQNRSVHNEHSVSLTSDQPQSPVTSSQSVQDLQDDGDLNTIRDGSDIPRPSKRFRSMSSVNPQLGDQTKAHSLLGPGWVPPHRKSPPGTKACISPKIKHDTPSRKPGLSTPNTRSLESSNTHLASQQPSDQRLPAKPRTMHELSPEPLQQEQAEISNNQRESKPSQSVDPLGTNDMRVVKQILVPKLCDILKDFPTSPENAAFLPLLRRLVEVTIANNPQATEERYLDLHTHVVTNCTSSSPTDQVETASLARPLLKILSRHRHRLAVQTHSQFQRDISTACRANDLDWLRAKHAKMLIFEVWYEEGQR